VATSDEPAGRVVGYLGSAKNITGSVSGLVGVGLGAAGLAGPYWPGIVVVLYAAGALIAPPKRPDTPEFTAEPTDELGALRTDLASLRDYLGAVELPETAAEGVSGLLEVFGSLLEPGRGAESLHADPEAMHIVSRAIRNDVPDCVDAFVRTRWWARLQSGTESPEGHLERQLAVLRQETDEMVAGLEDAERRHQESISHYLEDRHKAP
jgi:hypothetical protein